MDGLCPNCDEFVPMHTDQSFCDDCLFKMVHTKTGICPNCGDFVRMYNNEQICNKCLIKKNMQNKKVEHIGVQYIKDTKITIPEFSLTLCEFKKLHPTFPFAKILVDDLKQFANENRIQYNDYLLYIRKHIQPTKQLSNMDIKKDITLAPDALLHLLSTFLHTKDQNSLHQCCKLTTNIKFKYNIDPKKSIIDDYYASASTIKLLFDLRIICSYYGDNMPIKLDFNTQFEIPIVEGYTDYHVLVTIIKIKRTLHSYRNTFDIEAKHLYIPWNNTYENKYGRIIKSIDLLDGIYVIKFDNSTPIYTGSIDTDINYKLNDLPLNKSILFVQDPDNSVRANSGQDLAQISLYHIVRILRDIFVIHTLDADKQDEAIDKCNKELQFYAHQESKRKLHYSTPVGKLDWEQLVAGQVLKCNELEKQIKNLRESLNAAKETKTIKN
jgi:hypothetical protein